MILIGENAGEEQNKATNWCKVIDTSHACGTDLHFIRGTVSDMAEGTILGHEGVGVVEKVGSNVRNFKGGDRVVIPSWDIGIRILLLLQGGLLYTMR